MDNLDTSLRQNVARKEEMFQINLPPLLMRLPVTDALLTGGAGWLLEDWNLDTV